MATEIAVQSAIRAGGGRGGITKWLRANRLVASGALIVGGLVLTAVFAPQIAPHDPLKPLNGGLDASGMPSLPGTISLLGTDQVGRDLLSRLIFGGRISLFVGTVAMLTALVIGVSIGLLAGYWGGIVDAILMRFTDIMMTIPSVLLAIALAGLLQERRGLVSLFFVIGVVSWTTTARVVRGQVLSLKEREFVEAARAIGCSHRRILLKHILPNILPVIVVLATMNTAGTILLDAGLSFLGIGVPPPAPSWGAMISDGQPYMLAAPWLVLAPGLAVVLAVGGFNLLGQGLQDALDPYQKGK